MEREREREGRERKMVDAGGKNSTNAKLSVP